MHAPGIRKYNFIVLFHMLAILLPYSRHILHPATLLKKATCHIQPHTNNLANCSDTNHSRSRLHFSHIMDVNLLLNSNKWRRKNLTEYFQFEKWFSSNFQSQGNIFFLLCFAVTHFRRMQSLAPARNMSVQEMEWQRLTLVKIAPHARTRVRKYNFIVLF